MSHIPSDAEVKPNSLPKAVLEDNGEMSDGENDVNPKTEIKDDNDILVAEYGDGCIAILKNIKEGRTETEDPESLVKKMIDSDDFVDISPFGDRGVRKYTIHCGVGTESPSYGDKVTIHYSYWKMKGTVGLTEAVQIEGCEHFEFVLGRANVMKALEITLYTMKTGEEADCITLPQYAVQESVDPHTQKMPSNEMLFLKIKLLKWCHEDLSPKKDKGIFRKCLVEPTSAIFPNDGAFVRVHTIGFCKGRAFDDREVEFTIGEGCLHNIPEGIEIALLKFRMGEKSKLSIAHQYAFGAEGKPESNIPPLADIECDVTLLYVERAKEIWEMNTDDKWQCSVEAKQRGNTLYQAGYVKAALKQYNRIVKCLENEPGVAAVEVECRQKLLIAGYLNVALCLSKLNNFMETVKVCDKVIQIDPLNEKGLFRRGQGYFMVNDFEMALLDFEKIISHYPNNRAAKNHFNSCKTQIAVQQQKERDTYRNMFRRFSEEDEERRKQQQCQTETGVWSGLDCNMIVHTSSTNDDDDAIVQMLNQQNLNMSAGEALGQ